MSDDTVSDVDGPGTRLSSTGLQTSEPERPTAGQPVVEALRQAPSAQEGEEPLTASEVVKRVRAYRSYSEDGEEWEKTHVECASLVEQFALQQGMIRLENQTKAWEAKLANRDAERQLHELIKLTTEVCSSTHSSAVAPLSQWLNQHARKTSPPCTHDSHETADETLLKVEQIAEGVYQFLAGGTPTRDPEGDAADLIETFAQQQVERARRSWLAGDDSLLGGYKQRLADRDAEVARLRAESKDLTHRCDLLVKDLGRVEDDNRMMAAKLDDRVLEPSATPPAPPDESRLRVTARAFRKAIAECHISTLTRANQQAHAVAAVAAGALDEALAAPLPVSNPSTPTPMSPTHGGCDSLRAALTELCEAIHDYDWDDPAWDHVRVPYELALGALSTPTPNPAPIPMRLACEGCGKLHIDEGEFATKVHHTHSCQFCGLTWRPAVVATVGVRFLPGFKNDQESNPP